MSDIFPPLILQADQLSCWRDERFLFSHLNLQVRNGQAVQIIGENGSGKSSLLRLLTGLLLPFEGKVAFNNLDILQHRAAYYAHLSYLGHEPGVKLPLTPAENCRALTNVSNEEIRVILTQIGLAKFTDVLCHQLSAGQKRRVALARILLQKRGIWILDEPLTALDHSTKQFWQAQIQQQIQRGGIVVFTTHQSVELANIPIEKIVLSGSAAQVNKVSAKLVEGRNV